jgi:cytidylate kinase
MEQMGRDATLEDVKRQLAERDRKDSSRPVGALRRTDDMIVLDTTDMSIEEVVDTMVRRVREQGSPAW